MAAAFLLEPGRRRSSSEFMRQAEEDGIKFSIENTAEDIVNGLFCTYEPPTSKKDQYRAAKAVRKDPTKYDFRPSVPKSILKWKIKKNKKTNEQRSTSTGYGSSPPDAPSTTNNEARDDANDGVVVFDSEGNKKSVTWRDQASKGGRTEIENKVVGLASKYCGGACNQGEDIADILSSPTGRATQAFFAGGPETPGSMASVASSIFGRQSPAAINNSDKKVLYDDLGNPVREDEVQEDGNGSYFHSTPKNTDASTPTNTAAAATGADNLKNGHSNLFCSNIPFMDTMIEGIGIAGVVAASAAVAAGVPENLCSPYTKAQYNTNENENETQLVRVSSPEQAQITEELNRAQRSLGVYEPESYDQPAPVPGAFKLNRQSTPRHKRSTDSTVGDEDNNNVVPTPTNRSYAASDITMGSNTIKHFSENASLFDETVGGESSPAPTKSPRKAPQKGGFSSMVEELKQVQLDKGLEGSSQHGEDNNKSVNTSVEDNKSVRSLQKGYEKIAKSPKKLVVADTYLKSTKSPKKSMVVTNSYLKSLQSPSTPRADTEIFEKRSGTVADLAKQFESPRAANRPSAFRKSIDPTECRQFDGKVNFLPPTPRRKAPAAPARETPSGYSMIGSELKQFDWKNTKTSNKQQQDEVGQRAASAVSVNTDAEIREAASTILDVGPSSKAAAKRRPTFGGRRPRSLVTGPETVEDEDNNNGPPEERQDTTEKKSKQKSKKEKSKSKDRFATKFKKSMEKALNPVRNVTRKVESQRIAKNDS